MSTRENVRLIARCSYKKKAFNIREDSDYSVGCSEKVLQYLVLCKLSYSYFVCAGCYNSDKTVQMLSAVNGRFVNKWARS